MILSLITLYLISFTKVNCNETCVVPYDCYIETSRALTNIHGFEKTNNDEEFKLITCFVYQDFSFDYDYDWMSANKKLSDEEWCYLDRNDSRREIIEFYWPTETKELNILDWGFNITYLYTYMEFYMWGFHLNLRHLRGIDLNLIEPNSRQITSKKLRTFQVHVIILSYSTLNFYIDRKLVKTCKDISQQTSNNIQSIFQILEVRETSDVYLEFDNCEYKQKVCPLVFKNSETDYFRIIGLIDSFYKTNVLQFWKDEFPDLNSYILKLMLYKVSGIKLDTNIVNPSVFQSTQSIFIEGYVDSVSDDLFDNLASLRYLFLQSTHFRKLVHKNGIGWINNINRHIKVDLNNDSDILKHLNKSKLIIPSCSLHFQDENIEKIFPDEDFCIYKDFPFDRLVVIGHFCIEDNNDLLIKILKSSEFSCTYMWLTQYYKNIGHLYSNISGYITKRRFMATLEVLKSQKKDISECEFQERLKRCNKSNFQINDFWSKSDYFTLNKKLQIGIKISNYLVSILGIVNNLILIVIIIHKTNKDLFKDLKQYSYLCLNSVFALLISLIEILSWMNECFYPFEVFCPEIRKLISIQYFRIIAKECLLTAFRFICNFCYVAFALNRISFLGKDHGRIVTFISNVNIIFYLIGTVFISIGLSVMKFFKYEINLGLEDLNYPSSNEMDILTISNKDSTIFDDAYLTSNSISDVINYVVFVLICLIIDIGMVVRLRRTLTEKLKRLESLNKASLDKKSKENEDVIKKAIKMVVINTAIGLIFKAPAAFIPLVNVYAEYYYKNFDNRYKSPKFGEFYSSLFDTGFYVMIQDVSDLLFSISIAIQFYVYIHFDKKINRGFYQLFFPTKTESKTDTEINNQTTLN